MSKQYKVWVYLEEIDEDDDFYEDVGLPDCLGTFESLKAAKDFVHTLPGWEDTADTSDLK